MTKPKRLSVKKEQDETSRTPVSVTLTGTITCMPSQSLAGKTVELPSIGLPIMPEGFVIDTGFLPPPVDLPDRS
jgi:hypothetical protein